jgi:uncharacterized protein (DUF58 family)
VSRWARPAHPRAPIVASVLIIGLWWLVAHNAGSGWIQVLGDLIFGALVIGLAGPFFVVTRARLAVRVAPGDAVAGLPASLSVSCGSRLRVRPVDPPGPEAFVGPRGRGGPNDDQVILLPERRGVHEWIELDVASAAPFALQWWSRRVRLPLPAALHVSPRCGPARSVPRRPDEGTGDVLDRPHTEEGLARGVRAYVPGDARRHVHWRATAHAGQLMVRELERPVGEPVTVTVELPLDPEAAERMAERALGSVVGLLEGGTPVLLVTTEATGPAVGAVADRRSAGRRLARAVAGRDGGP